MTCFRGNDILKWEVVNLLSNNNCLDAEIIKFVISGTAAFCYETRKFLPVEMYRNFCMQEEMRVPFVSAV